MQQGLLNGMRVLVLEDEFLIAMDVEQMCRDNGAADVVIARRIDGLGRDPFAGESVDVAILDVRLGSETTTGFAGLLHARGIPFIFATGYVHDDRVFAGAGYDFTQVPVLLKPFTEKELIGALARAISPRICSQAV